jgi:hypothetical protein
MEMISKYPDERFVIAGDFRKAPAQAGEELLLVSCTATAVDKYGHDASADILTAGTLAADGTRLSVRCKNGDATKSPYQVTFVMETTLNNCYITKLEIAILI